VAAIGARSVQGVDLADRAAGELLDLGGKLHEGIAELGSEQAPEGAIAGSPQADGRDPAGASRGLPAGAEEPPEGDPRLAQLGLGTPLEQLADQQPLRRGSRDVADQFGEGAVEGTRDLVEDEDRGVAGAVLEIREMPLRHPRRGRYGLAREASPRPQAADALAERAKEEIAVGQRGAAVPCVLLRESRGLGARDIGVIDRTGIPASLWTSSLHEFILWGLGETEKMQYSA